MQKSRIGARRNSSSGYGVYKQGGRESTGGIFGKQLFLCSLALLALLAGWLFETKWFEDGKRLLLEQMRAEDEIAQAYASVQDYFAPKDQEKSGAGSSDPAAGEKSEANESRKKLEDLYRYIEQYNKDEGGAQPQAEKGASFSDSLGAGGFMPVLAAPQAEKYDAPEDCLLSPAVFSAKPLLPVQTATVTSVYGYRLHPISGKLDFHTGIDLATAQGSKIFAAWPGTVKASGFDEVYGNFVLLAHGDGLETFYGHMETILVKEGMVLRRGELLGTVGSTGVSTGPHLHWEIRVDDKRTDPVWALMGVYKSQTENHAG